MREYANLSAARCQILRALTHREKIAYLRHRASLNQHVLDITRSMAAVNTKAIEVNKAVMDALATVGLDSPWVR